MQILYIAQKIQYKDFVKLNFSTIVINDNKCILKIRIGENKIRRNKVKR